MIAGKRKKDKRKDRCIAVNTAFPKLSGSKMFKASVGVRIQSIAIHLDESESDKWTSDLLVKTYLRSLAT